MRPTIPFTIKDSSLFFLSQVRLARKGEKDTIKDIFLDGVYAFGRFYTFSEAHEQLEFPNGQPFGKEAI